MAVYSGKRLMVPSFFKWYVMVRYFGKTLVAPHFFECVSLCIYSQTDHISSRDLEWTPMAIYFGISLIPRPFSVLPFLDFLPAFRFFLFL